MQGTGGGNQGGSGGQRGGPQISQSVRSGGGNGNNGLGNNGNIRCYPSPIQRPVTFQSMQQPQQQRQRVPQQPRPQPTSHQQHIKMSSQYYAHQGIISI